MLGVEDPTEVDIPDEPIQAAVYEQVSIVVHLRKTELESLMRRADSRQQWRTWVREGELWWYAVTARPGLLHWPAIPPNSSFRMIVWSGEDRHGVVQRCVDPLQATVTSLDVQALSPARVVLVLSSKLWMLMDPTEEWPAPLWWQRLTSTDQSEEE